MRHGGNVWEGQPADWLDFSANLRPEGTPAWVMDTMRAALLQACYYPDRAMRAARAGLALYLGVDESCVLPTAGGAAAIDLTLGVRRGAHDLLISGGGLLKLARAGALLRLQVTRRQVLAGESLELLDGLVRKP